MTGPVAVIDRSCAAEADYINAGGTVAGPDLAAIAATPDPDVVLHQSPDRPWGGEFRGHAGYEEWARAMSAALGRLEVGDRRCLAEGDTVIVSCRLATRSRAAGVVLDHSMVQVVRVRGDHIVEFRAFYRNVPAYRAAVGSGR